MEIRPAANVELIVARTRGPGPAGHPSEAKFAHPHLHTCQGTEDRQQKVGRSVYPSGHHGQGFCAGQPDGRGRGPGEGVAGRRQGGQAGSRRGCAPAAGCGRAGHTAGHPPRGLHRPRRRGRGGQGPRAALYQAGKVLLVAEEAGRAGRGGGPGGPRRRHLAGARSKHWPGAGAPAPAGRAPAAPAPVLEAAAAPPAGAARAGRA